MSEPYIAVKQSCILGESPVWSVAEQALYWVDIRNPMIYRLDPASGDVRNWRVQTEIGSIGLAGEGRLIAGTRMGIAYIGLDDNSFEELADPEGDGRMNAVRMNDGKVDRQGRFWCGGMDDPGYAEVASLYRFDHDHSIHRMAGPVTISNALCWSPDNTIMYFADSRKRTMWAYDFDAVSGAIENRRVFLEVADGEGVPGGFRARTRRRLAFCRRNGCYRPAGTRLRRLNAPCPTAPRPSFDPGSRDGLFHPLGCRVPYPVRRVGRCGATRETAGRIA